MEDTLALITRANDALRDYRDSDRTAMDSTALTTMVSALDGLLQELRTLLAAATALDAVGVTWDCPDSVAPLARDCRKLTDRLKVSDRGVARDWPAGKLQQAESKLAAELKSAWQQYVEDTVPDRAGWSALAETFRSISPDLTPAANELERAASDINRISRGQGSQSGLQQLAGAEERARDALATLTGGFGGEGEDVLRFINGLSAGGAEISALTPIVVDWMERTGISARFIITTKRSPRA